MKYVRPITMNEHSRRVVFIVCIPSDMGALVYDHNCPGSRAYMALARELIGRLPEQRKAA